MLLPKVLCNVPQIEALTDGGEVTIQGAGLLAGSNHVSGSCLKTGGAGDWTIQSVIDILPAPETHLCISSMWNLNTSQNSHQRSAKLKPESARITEHTCVNMGDLLKL